MTMPIDLLDTPNPVAQKDYTKIESESEFSHHLYEPDHDLFSPIVVSNCQAPEFMSPLTPLSLNVMDNGNDAAKPDKHTMFRYENTNIATPDLNKLKSRRQQRTALWGVTGTVVGLVTLGPVGAVAGGVTSALLVKQRHKMRERKVMKKYYQSVAEQMAAPLPQNDTDTRENINEHVTY